jgi:hypothetical protein
MPSSDSRITNRENDVWSNWSLWIAVASQLATIAITWPLWQIRNDPPLLPAFSLNLPQVNFGWLMVGSCLLTLFRPWMGVWLHLAVILVACVFDEMRTQPQFFAIWVLMLASAKSELEPVARWFLISMWIWAGAHKILSPDWFTHSVSDLLIRVSLDPEAWHWPFAIGIAAVEIIIGIAAIFRPRQSAVLCPLMHFGIILFVSPLALNWNYSVIPWNLASALIGFRILRRTPTAMPTKPWEYVVAALLLIYPSGFYAGWVDHGISFVFYSEHTPLGLVSTNNESKLIRGWTNVNVPFPNERRLLRRHFEASAKPGDKLHIRDPRAMLNDQFFILVKERQSEEISEQEFRSTRNEYENLPNIKGILLDDYVALWHLGRRGVKMLKRSKESMIYAVAIPPEAYSSDLLNLINRIPNLEQLQLEGTSISDEEFSKLTDNPSLIGLGLAATKVSDQSISVLKSMPNLRYVEFEGSQLTPTIIREFLAQRSLMSSD